VLPDEFDAEAEPLGRLLSAEHPAQVHGGLDLKLLPQLLDLVVGQVEREIPHHDPHAASSSFSARVRRSAAAHSA